MSCSHLSQMWPAATLENLSPSLFTLSPIHATWHCVSVCVSVIDRDGLTELAGHHSPHREQRKGHCLGFYLSIHPWTLHCSPFPLHMEEGSRSFAVWWRCVLTQQGDEDGILIGLIELMLLSPLVGEECQASRWLFASWLLSACCSYTLTLTWTVSLCFWLSLLSSVSLHLYLSCSLSCIFLFLTHSPFKWIKAALIMYLCRKYPLFIQVLIL